MDERVPIWEACIRYAAASFFSHEKHIPRTSTTQENKKLLATRSRARTLLQVVLPDNMHRMIFA